MSFYLLTAYLYGARSLTMRIPRPSECIGIVGVAIAIVGMVVGGYLVLFQDVYPWGWLTFVLSFVLWLGSALYCLGWEWDHLLPV